MFAKQPSERFIESEEQGLPEMSAAVHFYSEFIREELSQFFKYTKTPESEDEDNEGSITVNPIAFLISSHAEMLLSKKSKMETIESVISDLLSYLKEESENKSSSTFTQGLLVQTPGIGREYLISQMDSIKKFLIELTTACYEELAREEGVEKKEKNELKEIVDKLLEKAGLQEKLTCCCCRIS